MTNLRPSDGQLMANSWLSKGEVWPSHGSVMAKSWVCHGQAMAKSWRVMAIHVYTHIFTNFYPHITAYVYTHGNVLCIEMSVFLSKLLVASQVTNAVGPMNKISTCVKSSLAMWSIH